jgi:putative transposase
MIVSYKTVRRWCIKFGRTFANRLRCQRLPPGDKWHIQGVQHYHWCAVEQQGVVLDIVAGDMCPAMR